MPENRSNHLKLRPLKRTLLLFCLLGMLLPALAQKTFVVLDSVVFHDGYAAYVPDTTLPDGVLKLRNDLFARRLGSAELEMLGGKLTLRVFVKALCDNYDRLAGVNLALVAPGAVSYVPDSVPHLELGRFITPFMSKNVLPDTVSYTFRLDNLPALLRDKDLSRRYDFWLELSIFGIPYAARKQVAGCSERNDVFQGRLEWITEGKAPKHRGNVVMPLFFKHPFNNYTVGATDSLGSTTKQCELVLDKPLRNATLYLITSNHGANEGGEEYIRRDHFVFFDDKQVWSYKPGRTSCEPFRSHNTQRNGIYGKEPQTDAEWQSFSNWCPGDVIDIRTIRLGTVSAGIHTFRIAVPDAVFSGKQGDFPLSLYIQGNH
jgi:hypothetical protein